MSTNGRAHLSLAALALAGASLAGIGAAAPTPPPAGLSITIDNGAKTTAPDSDVSYTVTLANAGASPVTVWIVADVPPYGTITDAGGGQASGQNDTWQATVEPGKTQVETVKAHIGEIPKGTYRVTTLASVYLDDDTSGAPVIRSADSDAIPGVKEPAAPEPTQTAVTTSKESGGDVLPLTVGIGVGIVVLVVIAVVIIASRRGRRGARRRAR